MNPIVVGIGKKALELFYQKFGRRLIKTAADKKWMANTIRLLKQKAHKPKTSDIAQKVREGLRKDRPFQGFKPPIFPKQFNKFKPEIVPKKDMFNNIFTKMYKEVMGPPKIVPKVVPKVVKPKVEKSNVIPLFPKKPPTLKADGGRIDKALPKKSWDI